MATLIEYTGSNEERIFAPEKGPEYINTGTAWVHKSVAGELGMLRRWRQTPTGWALDIGPADELEKLTRGS